MTELESQLRSLRRPTQPLDAADFDEVRALGGTRDHRRVVWRLAAASVVVIVALAGLIALQSRRGSVDTVATGPTRSFTLAAVGSASPEQLDQSALVVEKRLQALGIDHATVDVRDGVIEVTVPEGIDQSRLVGLVEPGRVEFRPVLDEQPSASGSGPRGTTATPSSPPSTIAPDGSGVLDDGTERLTVGPAALTGGIDHASATLNPVSRAAWVVNPFLKAGPDGIDRFNDVAAKCYQRDAVVCPTGRIAVVVNGVLLSAPSINAGRFDRDQIQISGAFTEQSAKELAAQMGSGELPVRLRVR